MDKKNNNILIIIFLFCLGYIFGSGIASIYYRTKENKKECININDTIYNKIIRDSIIYDIKYKDSIIYKIKTKAKYEIEKAINANYDDAVEQFIILSTDTARYDFSTGK